MSTRTQIGFYESGTDVLTEPEAMVYKHFDGYPENMVPILEEFLKKKGAIGRRTDTEYLSAWFLYFLIKDHVQMMEEYNEKRKRDGLEIFDKAEDFSGHGISKEFHGDIDFYYAVYPDKVYVCNGNLEVLEVLDI